MQRVVITGSGAIAASGLDVPQIWASLIGGRSAIGPVANIATDGLHSPVAAEVKGFDPSAHFQDKLLATIDRVSQFALVAARGAVRQSGIDFQAGNIGERAAVVVGTGVGGEQTHEEQLRRLYGDKKPRVHPMTIVRVMPSAPASQLSIAFGIKGPTFAVSSACASANHAIAQAFRLVRTGEVDIALAGGTEACITHGTLKAWEAMRVLADDTCRPFSAHRRGVVLGEGAGIFVLESEEHARQRGAHILAELAGIGESADAADLVYPDESGAARAMARALLSGGLATDAVAYINAHGTGTLANDPTETRAIRQVFGEHANRLAVSSTKGAHGHALGASGAIELVAVLGALQHGVIPPTANFLEPDPACDLDYVPNVSREQTVPAALSNAFAFGGLNCVLALRRV